MSDVPHDPPADLPSVETPALWPWLTPARAGAFVALIALVYGVITLRGHGVTFDEPALFHAGDRTLYAMLHPGDRTALDLNQHVHPGFQSDFLRFPDVNDPVHYPVFPGLVAAITNWIFHSKLHVLNTIDGHHLGLVVLHAAALFLFCVYACRLLGRAAGIAAVVALALYPSAVGHSFNNAKDWPCAQYYGVFLLAMGVGVRDARFRDLVVAGVLLGVAFAGKMNAAFAVATMLAWTPVAYGLLYHRRGPLPVGLVGGVLLVPYIAAAVFVALWPWLYYGNLVDWWAHLSEYIRFMVNYGVGHRQTWTAHPFRCVLYMSPPLVLAAAGVFAATGWRGDARTRATYALLLLWVGVPVLRIAAPKSNFYDANRHFIEYIPGLCAMAGAGTAWIGERLCSWLRRPSMARWLSGRRPVWALAGFACVATAALVWPVLQYRPFETTYFNMFIGGLGGAQRTGLFVARAPADRRANGTEGDYWFSSLRVGLEFAASETAPNQPIGICGVPEGLSQSNWPYNPRLLLTDVNDTARVVYVAPREFFCGLTQIRELETQRPVLRRVERGGGLVYELLGARDGRRHPVLTRQSVYTQPGWYERKVTVP